MNKRMRYCSFWTGSTLENHGLAAPRKSDQVPQKQSSPEACAALSFTKHTCVSGAADRSQLRLSFPNPQARSLKDALVAMDRTLINIKEFAAWYKKYHFISPGGGCTTCDRSTSKPAAVFMPELCHCACYKHLPASLAATAQSWQKFAGRGSIPGWMHCIHPLRVLCLCTCC